MTLLFFISDSHTPRGTDKANGPQRVTVRVAGKTKVLWLRIATSKISPIAAAWRSPLRRGENYLGYIEIP